MPTETGATAGVIANPQHPYTRTLLTGRPHRPATSGDIPTSAPDGATTRKRRPPALQKNPVNLAVAINAGVAGGAVRRRLILERSGTELSDYPAMLGATAWRAQRYH